jgi:hypothetical protein
VPELFQKFQVAHALEAAEKPIQADKRRHRYVSIFLICVHRSSSAANPFQLNANDECLWTYDGDHLRRRAAEHRRQLQRGAKGQKAEARPVPAFAERRQAGAAKFRRRMHSACHEFAAQLAGYADRRRFAGVRYDDRDQGYCQQFPWFEFRRLLAEKLNARGIALEMASGSPATSEADPLAAAEEAEE